MNRIRERLFWPLIVLIVVGCGAFMWRKLHPSLTPEEQVTLATNQIGQAVENRNAKSVSSLLAPDFAWESGGGMGKKDLITFADGAFLSWRDVHVELSGVQVTVKGETASSHGSFRATLRQSADGTVETHKGNFDLEWVLRDGQWRVAKARGDGVPGLGGVNG